MNAPWAPGKTPIGQREPFAAYVCDDMTADALRAAIADYGWAADKVYKGGLRNAVQSLSVAASPTILFVDLSEVGDPLNDINALAEVCEPGTIVIAIGHINDVRLYRDLLASGIQDYMLKPCSIDHLRDSFAHAQATLAAPKVADATQERAHLVTAVIGARGGVGASTIATSLGWLFGDAHGRSTALLDLDIHFGTGALLLDIEPGRGLSDAIDNPSRIDGLFIERAMVKATDMLAVLSAESPINQPLMTDGLAFYQLQEELRGAFECTVIDLPRGMLVQYPHLMTEIQVALLVVELTLASARDAIRVLAWMKSNAPKTQVMIVCNKVDSKIGSEITRKDFESSIERKIDVIIPADAKILHQASKLGKPVVDAARGSKVATALAGLAKRLVDQSDEPDDVAVKASPKGKSLLGKFSAMPMMNKGKAAAKPEAAAKSGK